jgi:hypothetical protein
MKAWERDKAWADTLNPVIERIIRSQAGRLISISATGKYEDQQLAQDYRIGGANIASRFRRAEKCGWRDMTLRWSRPSQVRMEIDKIRQGHVHWYLYGWAFQSGAVDWMLVDCRKIPWLTPPNQLILPPPPDVFRKHNWDGSSDFLVIRRRYLHKVCALVDGVIGGKRLTPGRDDMRSAANTLRAQLRADQIAELVGHLTDRRAS